MWMGAFSAAAVGLVLGVSARTTVEEGPSKPLPDRGATIDCWTLPRHANDQPEIIIRFSEQGALDVSLEGKPLCHPSLACRREERTANDKMIVIEDEPQVDHYLTMVLDRSRRRLDVSDGELDTGLSFQALCELHRPE